MYSMFFCVFSFFGIKTKWKKSIRIMIWKIYLVLSSHMQWLNDFFSHQRFSYHTNIWMLFFMGPYVFGGETFGIKTCQTIVVLETAVYEYRSLWIKLGWYFERSKRVLQKYFSVLSFIPFQHHFNIQYSEGWKFCFSLLAHTWNWQAMCQQ